MAIELNALIHVYDDVLSPDACQYLIDLYETNSDRHEKIDNDKRPAFTQFNFSDHHQATAQSAKAHDDVLAKVIDCRNRYYEFVDGRCFPPENGLEKLRIKKYRNNGQELFDTHVDVQNLESARRFLSFIFYLNDVPQGGETVFYTGKTVEARTGRVVIFPPMWMFPHKGCVPVSNEKYIMSTYLHYR